MKSDRTASCYPTAAEINALPEKVRLYIHDLETHCDKSGDVQTIALLREDRVMRARIAVFGQPRRRDVDEHAIAPRPHVGHVQVTERDRALHDAGRDAFELLVARIAGE